MNGVAAVDEGPEARVAVQVVVGQELRVHRRRAVLERPAVGGLQKGRGDEVALPQVPPVLEGQRREVDLGREGGQGPWKSKSDGTEGPVDKFIKTQRTTELRRRTPQLLLVCGRRGGAEKHEY